MGILIIKQEKMASFFSRAIINVLGDKKLSLDWDIYSDKILELIDSNKSKLLEEIAEPIKEFIDENVYFIHDEMSAIVDVNTDDFILRLAWDCSVSYTDDRNILFSLKEEINNCYDIGALEKLVKLKLILENNLKTIEENIGKLKKELGED